MQPRREAVDSDSKSAAIADTGGSGKGIANLESAGSQLQQERAPTVSQPGVGSQLQQVSKTQVPRRSTVSSVDDVGLGGIQHQEIWKGKSHQPDLFGIILRSWSLLRRRQGLAPACSVFSRVPFSFLSSSVHEAKKRRAKQVITCSFPCGQWLHMIGARASPRCELCRRERETRGASIDRFG